MVASRDILEIMGKNKYEQAGFREILQIPRKIWEKLEDTRKMLVWDALGSRLKISRELGRNLPWQSGFDSLCLCFGTEMLDPRRLKTKPNNGHYNTLWLCQNSELENHHF